MERKIRSDDDRKSMIPGAIAESAMNETEDERVLATYFGNDGTSCSAFIRGSDDGILVMKSDAVSTALSIRSSSVVT